MSGTATFREEQVEQQRNIRQRSVYLVNVGDEPWRVEGRYKRGQSVYLIPSRGSKRFSVTEITGAKDIKDLGDNQSQTIEIMADEIARDIIREQGLSEYGVFMSYSEKPSEDDLLLAERFRQETYTRKVEEADALWLQFQQTSMISGIAKRCAGYLGLDRDYLTTVPLVQECPACGEKIKQGVVKCKHCRTILDLKRAEKMGLIKEA